MSTNETCLAEEISSQHTKMKITAKERKTVQSILLKTDKKAEIKNLKTITFSGLFKYLNGNEIAFVKKFLKVDPRKHGFKGNFLGVSSVPKNLVTIKNQVYQFRRKKKIVGEQHLPQPVYNAYRNLNQALKKEKGQTLLIDSGYRSPAYQVITFFYYLKLNEFDVSKTIKRVAIPGYSEHGAPRRQAIDFMTTKGIPSDSHPLSFERTVEYRWLLGNAHRFGFYLSYPKDNGDGIMFEPWHWHFKK